MKGLVPFDVRSGSTCQSPSVYCRRGRGKRDFAKNARLTDCISKVEPASQPVSLRLKVLYSTRKIGIVQRSILICTPFFLFVSFGEERLLTRARSIVSSQPKHRVVMGESFDEVDLPLVWPHERVDAEVKRRQRGCYHAWKTLLSFQAVVMTCSACTVGPTHLDEL